MSKSTSLVNLSKRVQCFITDRRDAHRQRAVDVCQTSSRGGAVHFATIQNISMGQGDYSRSGLRHTAYTAMAGEHCDIRAFEVGPG
ncbi:hypothetical protein SCLCIDRAFT_1089668 [Scleroderma citrinum Foug A]|uniref:Uncharacterized protein n=1 Tax=Scleroderma citrinum Foug A TaxID=1036808 RepID=A0A0C3DQM2_9AGAM|nr:hypothetical protein SCLCIDRAFT_1089668 [Scleroderma citrinum Foug A]